jgi:3-deoxy-manno-octulosonate cytidylyltransferase (CMP-KDO synthetase)
MKLLGIIPARFASTRFPGKPLAIIHGKTMIQRVYEQCKKAALLSEVVVATDDDKIFEHVKSFGGKVILTKPNHESGTDRCAEVIQNVAFQNYEAVINIQGDEPYIHPEQIDAVATLLNKGKQIVTLRKQLTNNEDILSPNVVKCVCASNGKALYFSRSPVPFIRGEDKESFHTHKQHYKHIGIYGFQRKTLVEVSQLEMGTLEKAESLEQLRWLDAGYEIFAGITEYESVGIDSPEDINKLSTV